MGVHLHLFCTLRTYLAGFIRCWFGKEPSVHRLTIDDAQCQLYRYRRKCGCFIFSRVIYPQVSLTSTGVARRSSITSDFLAEENRREKELERILDRRIEDLKTNTDYIIRKYT